MTKKMLYCKKEGGENTVLNDLVIKNVVRLYHIKHRAWARNRFSERGSDAIVLFTEGKIEYHFATGTLTAEKGDFLL